MKVPISKSSVELKGEVKKFEDLEIPRYVVNDCGDEYPDKNGEHIDAREFDRLKNFYTQPFTPDKIDLFEGWEKKYDDYYEVIYEDRHAIDYTFTVDMGNYSINYNKLRPKPVTLSDFIDVCLNYGIKLTWR